MDKVEDKVPDTVLHAVVVVVNVGERELVAESPPTTGLIVPTASFLGYGSPFLGLPGSVAQGPAEKKEAKI